MSITHVKGLSYASSKDGTTPLYYDVCYVDGATNKPILLINHGFEGYRSLIIDAVRERMAALGFFVIVPDIRGHGTSGGVLS